MEIETLRPRYRFTVKDYYRMAEADILDPNTRVELIEGQILEMPPIGPPHAVIVDRLAALLIRAVGDRATVRTQHPVLLSEITEPQPDLCVVRPRDAYFHRHPEAEDILLVIEVSDSSVAYDRIKKGRLYSRSWIPEYWLVNIPDRKLEVYRSPGPEGYEEKQELRGGNRAVPHALPDVTVEIDEIFPPSP